MSRLPWILLVVAACGRDLGERDVVGYLAHQSAAGRRHLLREAEGRVAQPGVIHRGGKPVTLLGPTLDVGADLPDVTVVDGKLAPVALGSLRGKLVVFSVVPSIDTRVCETQTHKVSAAIEQMPPGTEVFTVSRDLPYAQTRFAEEAMTKTGMLSDYHGGAFGRAFGVEVEETGLLARSLWVVGRDGKIAYRQLVDEQGTEPDYDAMLAAVRRAAGS